MRLALILFSISSFAFAQIQSKIVEEHLDISPRKVHEVGYAYEGKSQIRPKHDGGALVVWEEFTGYETKKELVTHITPLNASLDRDGEDIVLRNMWVYDALTHKSGEIILTVGKIVGTNSYISDYPNFLYIVKVNYQGAILWQTEVIGASNQSSGDKWHDHGTQSAKLAFNGTNYSVYTPLMRDFAKAGEKKDVHQIDLFKVFNQNGQELTDQTVEWSCSHSNDQRIVSNENGDWITLTVGDGGPYGVVTYNRTTKERGHIYGKVIHEANKSLYPEGCGSTLCGGKVGNMYRINGYNYAIVSHCMDEKPVDYGQEDQDVLLLKFDDTPSLISKTWVTKNRAAITEDRAYMAPYGNNKLLIGWCDKDSEDADNSWGDAWLMVTDLNGNVLEAPVKTDAKINPYDSNFYPMANGDVVWSCAKQYDTKLMIYRVKADGGSPAPKNSGSVIKPNKVSSPMRRGGKGSR